MGMLDYEDQSLTGCYFVSGMLVPKGWPYKRKKVKLGQVDPVVISETLADLKVLSSKAK